MSASTQSVCLSEPASLLAAVGDAEVEKWYAVQTRARHEKVVAQQLRESGVTNFLPLVSSEHQWSDRRKKVELPLFSCYVFVRILPGNEERVRVLRVNGVLSFVGIRGLAIPIPDEQIHAVQSVIEAQVPYSFFPFLKIGQRVRVRTGVLTGVEGTLMSRSGDRALIISLDAIQRSLSLRLEGYDVEPV